MGARKIFKEFVITTIEKARDIFGYRKKLEEGKEKKQKQDEDNEFIETVVKEQEKKEQRIEKEKKEVLEKRKIYNLSSEEIYERQRQNQTKKQKDTLDRYYTEKKRMERARIRRLERIRANQGRSHKSNYNSRRYTSSTRRYTSSTNSKNSIKQTKSTYTQGVAKKQTKNNTNLKNKRKIKQQSLKNKNTSKIIIKEERPISKKSDKIIRYDERYKKDFQRMQKAYDKSSIYKVLDGGITEKKGKDSTKKAENEFKNRYSFVVKSPSSEPDNKTSKEEKNINRNIRPEEQKGTEHDLRNFFDL